ncbi:MAG: hypothetical protein LC785_00450 [Acidobacteria bacterium]|nr:hypothetical protein [Acidobacteriota bacterium]MCA1640462.1 hypothetical protein [Acidobacteriota bacterium]
MTKRMKNPMVLCAVIVVLLVTTLAAMQNQKHSLTQEEATPIKEGTMSEKQREHGKLYKEYETGKKLHDLTQKIGDVKLRRHVGTPGGDVNEPSIGLDKFLQSIACHADAVVMGEVTGKSSQLTENEDYIFTDYYVAVEEVIKDNPTAHIALKTEISVTRPGGKIKLNGRTVEAIDDAFQLFKIGNRYVLFLRFIPQTGAYKTLSSTSSFQVQVSKINKSTKEHLYAENELENENAESFLVKVRAASISSCVEREKGNAK